MVDCSRESLAASALWDMSVCNQRVYAFSRKHGCSQNVFSKIKLILISLPNAARERSSFNRLCVLATPPVVVSYCADWIPFSASRDTYALSLSGANNNAHPSSSVIPGRKAMHLGDYFPSRRSNIPRHISTPEWIAAMKCLDMTTPHNCLNTFNYSGADNRPVVDNFSALYKRKD
ncbi:hypothetical protein PAAG_11696 [Paracoccidioides lutzii Pb01]|uniref:Uncharacterized protein n=1 Tax=Paracoccidioides lutzii (strain ATCC MYA-826 / Pb01) TaxID=502779 RepID=A0A0A2V639_PARBA|nr:hypothetical protein PAAG_11696 [Paracoccidioides lutzii Pb01]KGQ01570.1 hypothetical protein PAAG_11696 [Paracoccidioides lutzii Pb01]